ncbi:MAG: hypothetical protein LBK67_09775 [Coriobacteriales bacterium]|jgi:hypothetical protein|nr:hypothetical protein [Coriobacteriales bacterium]
MITFGYPHIDYSKEGVVRLLCDFEDGNNSGELFFDVPEAYGDYLCTTRSDAYVIAALPRAMRTRQDIITSAPVTETLMFQIEQELIPALSKHSEMYPTRIFADTAPTLAKKPFYCAASGDMRESAVGTGFSLGTDSFYAIATLTDSPFSDLNLTHLAQYEIGAFNNSYRMAGKAEVQAQMFARTYECAKKLKLPLLQSTSNLKKSLPGDFELVATFYNLFAVYCMQEFWGAYHLGSHGCGLTPIVFRNFERQHSAFYDLLTLNCLSIPGLRFYSNGMAATRLEKIWTFSKLKQAQQYLHVCVSESYNCMECEKCRRTLLCLDILDSLDTFAEVFDIDYYRQHRFEYIAWLCQIIDKKDSRDTMVYKPIYDALLQKDRQLVRRIRQAMRA